MEIVGSMASTVVELLFDPIRRSVTRVFYYSRNVKSLETHMKELSDKKTRVQHSVEEAKNKTEVIEDDVENWLDSVDDITEEADRVLKDKDKAKKRCFMGLFPNLMTRYRVSTEIKSIEEKAVKIGLRGEFNRVSYLPARRGIGDRSVKDYEAFESRRHVLDEILEALKDNDVNLVGVCGMPGVGKTTIVKKVAEQVKANRIFDVVVLAVVSKTPDLKTIQGEIADGLGFKFEAETIRGRAERLRERLERETKVLVILDDIWERLELDDVGIPSGTDNRGCKILMTSRDRNALYREMDTKKLFHLQDLPWNEAWNLFKNMAGDAIKNPDLQLVAVEVAKKCAGLPILLVTVASALKDGELSEWKDAQFNYLQDCYLQKRRNWARQAYKEEERDTDIMNREGYNPGLEDFKSVLTNFTRYSRLRAVAELRNGANIVTSIEFDRDEQLFATAGISRRIKIFEFSSVMNEPADAHCPVVEMSTRSKLSCLSWNKYTQNHIASSDYKGIVTVWDVTTRQSIMEYEEHEKRAWSVDFSWTEPSMLVSGSDDCKVKIWSTKQEASVLNIDIEANICSVKYNPGSSIHLAVGSADHHIYYYDLRNISQPLYVFSGHQKAVSYVKFLSSNELASASTDSTLRLWDVKDKLALRTFRGHTNEKNFAGLTVNSEYIACGSETNEVFVYHKAISKPAARHRFSTDLEKGGDYAGSYFISAVCWKSDSTTMLTANSQGTIRVLVLAE